MTIRAAESMKSKRTGKVRPAQQPISGAPSPLTATTPTGERVANTMEVPPPAPALADLRSSPEFSQDGLLSFVAPSERLRFALVRPEQSNAQTVSLAETTSAYLFDREHHEPARIMLPVVEQHTADIAALLAGTHRMGLRRRLAVAGGQAAALAGWLAFEQGEPAIAHRYWDSALAAARTATDGPLLACVLTYLSYSATERGDPTTAWQLAHSAAAYAEPHPRAQAWMVARAAQEAAQLGDFGAAMAGLDLALDLGRELVPPAPEDSAPPWARFIDRAYIWAMAVNIHSRVGATDDAYKAAVWAVDSLNGNQVKARAVVLAEAAHGFAAIGGIERAMQCAIEAAELAERLEVTLAKRRLRALLPLLPKGESATKELRARLASK